MNINELVQRAQNAYQSGETQIPPALYPMVEHVFKCAQSGLPILATEAELLRQVAGIQEHARVTGEKRQ